MNKKAKCEICKRMLRTNKLLKNKEIKKTICHRCDKTIRKDKLDLKLEILQKITNFSITKDEEDFLKINRSESQIDLLCNYLKRFRNKKRRSPAKRWSIKCLK